MRVLVSICILFCMASCCNEESFETKTLRIFLENTHRYIPTTFETFTEQVLVKEAYHEGATFESVTEQVLLKDTYTAYRISSQTDIQVVTDAESYRINTLPCITFFDEEDFEETEVPAIYETRTYQRLAQDGNGPFHEASYTTRTFQRVFDPAILIPITPDQRASIDFEFNVSAEVSLDSFLRNQLVQQGISECLLEGSYVLVE